MKLLDHETVSLVILKAYDLLKQVGIRIDNQRALQMLGDHGASVDFTQKTARIRGDLIKRALSTVPSTISLFDENGEKPLLLGDEQVCFMPGSTAPFILDPDTGRQKRAKSSDIAAFVRLVDSLPNIQFNNPAFSISDVPPDFENNFRYFLALLHTSKPLAGGGVSSVESMAIIHEMISVVAGSQKYLRQKPRIFFSCCPTSPLLWDDNSCQKLMYCAQKRIPALILPAPGAGATSPVTLLGSVLQLVVEILSGIVIHQLVNSGAPVFCGSATTIMDMRSGKSIFGAVEGQMIGIASAQVYRHLGTATHGIMVTSDSLKADSQTGLEAAQGIMLGVLGGINVISGPGMLNSGLCQSFEKLIIDHDICTMALRLLRGIECTEETLAANLIRKIGPGGQFLTAEHTLKWARKEHCFPSEAIYRNAQFDQQNEVLPDSSKTAAKLVRQTMAHYETRELTEEKQKELLRIITVEGKRFGMDKLPHFS